MAFDEISHKIQEESSTNPGLKEPVICIETRVDMWGEWQISMTIIKYTSL